MNTTSFIEATRQLCAELDAAREQLVKDQRHMDDLEKELAVLRATDKNTDFAAKWREAEKRNVAAQELCEIYFGLACIGSSEAEVREKRDILIRLRHGASTLAAQEAKP